MSSSDKSRSSVEGTDDDGLMDILCATVGEKGLDLILELDRELDGYGLLQSD